METPLTSAVPSSSPLSGTGGFLEPEHIVRYFDLKSGDHVADFGAGHGYFTIPSAKTVGGDGKVYAIDIQKDVLEIVRAKAKLEHLLNIEFIWGDIEHPRGSHLKDQFIDAVIMANVLFQIEDKTAALREAFRVLRQGGRLMLIEWSQENASPLGPPKTMRVSKEDAKKIAADAGFTFDHEFQNGSHHYGLLFQKS